MTESQLSLLADSISAVGQSNSYASLSAYLRSLLGFTNVIIIAFRGEAPPTVLYRKAHGEDVFRLLETQYLPAAYLLDPVYQCHLNGLEGGVYRLMDMAPDQFRRSRYYKWYYGRIGILDEITVFLPVDGDTTLTVSMGTDNTSHPAISTKAEDAVRLHFPVITALLTANWRARERPAAARELSSSLPDLLTHSMKTKHDIRLSARQSEVALLVLQGHSTPSIAHMLGLSPETVKVFRRQLYAKCNISTQAELFTLMLPLLEGMRK